MVFWASLGSALQDILLAPLTARLWWQLIPVLFLWLVLEVYLTRHKREELGWNTALGNAISLFWITIAAMQPLFTQRFVGGFPWKIFFTLVPILSYAFFLGYASFTHTFNRHRLYALAAPTTVYFLSSMAILWGNRAVPVNRYVLLAAVLLFGLAWGARVVLLRFLPEAVHKGEELLHEAEMTNPFHHHPQKPVVVQRR